jgi:hypothetical protein
MPDDIQARCDLTQNHQIKLRIHNLLRVHAISGAVPGDFRWFSVEFGDLLLKTGAAPRFRSTSTGTTRASGSFKIICSEKHSHKTHKTIACPLVKCDFQRYFLTDCLR